MARTRDPAVRGATSDSIAPGRLLAYYPDAQLSDGVPGLETMGFFDGENAPPWDTWIALLRHDVASTLTDGNGYEEFLVAWVPNELVELADRGISADTVDSIAWLD